MHPDAVIKVGGSLLDRAGLGERLRAWLSACGLCRPALLAGGGAAVDWIRRLHAVHRLSEEASHWLAIEAMGMNGRLLWHLVPGSRIAASAAAAAAALGEGQLPILDPLPFLLADDIAAERLPHTWAATSDSIAARLAMLLGANTVVLLKACRVPPAAAWEALAKAGIVDEWFPQVAWRVGSIRLVSAEELGL